jgi:hypothetical protein
MPIEGERPDIHGPKYSEDHLSWWDGVRWKPLSEGPPKSADGAFWWNGAQWHPHHNASTGNVGRKDHGNLVVLIIGLAVAAAYALGIVNVQHHDNLGGWTVGAAGYSCWLAPAGDWRKTYCGTDSGSSHLPNPLSQH